MARLSYAFITCILVLSMGGFAYSGTEIMQDTYGGYVPGAFTGQAISDGSTLTEAFAAVSPSDSEAFINDSATRVFTSGQSVNLYARYSFDAERNYTLYWIVANGGGQIVFFDSITSTNGPGGVSARRLDLSLDPGTYLLNVVIIGEGATVMTPTPFAFVVE